MAQLKLPGHYKKIIVRQLSHYIFPIGDFFQMLKNDATSWTEIFLSFLESDYCPNFVKSDIERAKEKGKEPDDLSQEHEVLNSDVPQPKWMEALRPNPNYDNSSLNFTFDDGGPDHDQSETSHIYPDDLGKDWWDSITSAENENESLKIPPVDLDKMNKDQSLAFNIAMKTLVDFSLQTLHGIPPSWQMQTGYATK